MNTAISPDGALRLSHWGVIRARGSDAVKFLQGQLTNDVVTLGSLQTRLGGFCSAKGRLQASFVVWKAVPDDVLLACSASVLPATLKRMSMFVMRAQCKLTDATDELPLWGVVGDSAKRQMSDMAVGEKRDTEAGAWLRLPDVGGIARGVLAAAVNDARPAAFADAPAITLDAWRLLEVRSGIPAIEAATVDRFVPQMLNYELVGGVDFKKGCYPGQEVVARSQYRGTVKRRMFLFDIDAEIAMPGQEVFHSADAGQPAGMVVNAAPHGDGAGSSALVEVKLAALESGSLHLGSAAGPGLRRAELDYSIPTDALLPVG
ncbi:MAG: folate-binding protein YgfZ [Rhizobacter sp.]|nr:folate-binding protein YgfZ [Rhizobacter sp.]